MTARGEYSEHLLHQSCFRSVKQVPQSLTLLIRDTQDQNNDHANFFFVAVNRSMYYKQKKISQIINTKFITIERSYVSASDSKALCT